MITRETVARETPASSPISLSVRGSKPSRPTTIVPLQQLFVLNSDFLAAQSQALAERAIVVSADDEARIRRAYELVFNRLPTPRELELGREFLQTTGGDHAWQYYAQALLSSNEFAFID